MKNRVVVSVLGQDRVGIIAAVTGILASAQVNILDISQTILQDLFVMVTLVDMEKATVTLKELQQQLEAKAQELGVQITAQHEDVFRFMHRI